MLNTASFSAIGGNRFIPRNEDSSRSTTKNVQSKNFAEFMKNKKTRSKVYTLDEGSPMNSSRKHRKVSPSIRAAQKKIDEFSKTQKEWLQPFEDDNPLRIGSIAQISNSDMDKLNKEVKNITCNLKENDDDERKEKPTTKENHYFDQHHGTTLKMQSSFEIVANNEKTLTGENDHKLSKESYPTGGLNTGRSNRSKEPVTPINMSMDHDDF